MNRRRTYSHLCRVPAPRLRDAGVSVRQVPLRYARSAEIVLCWAEENRLLLVADNSHLSLYLYDAGGERAYKLTGDYHLQNTNGQWFENYTLTTPTLYASPYLVANRQGYTKHYYAGSERIVSKIGGGGLRGTDVLANVSSVNTLWDEVVAQTSLGGRIRPQNPQMNLMQGLYDWQDSVQPENDCYWYHPDHLGSSSWITYTDGSAVQHLHYLPWGEDFVDQRSTTWNAMYTFSAKERDSETGLSYFGSRYYSSDLSVWLSVDPMAHKYPSLSPYVYCANNPVKLVDPDGEEIDPESLSLWNSMRSSLNNEKFSARIGMIIEKATHGILCEGASNRYLAIDITLTTMETMEGSSQVYKLSRCKGAVSSVKYDKKDNSLTVNFSSTSGFIHEITHCGQFEKGWIGFSRKSGLVFSDIFDELEAYRNQSWYDPSSLPFVSAINPFSEDWVRNIYDGKKYPYKKCGLFPTNRDSTMEDIRKAYPGLNWTFSGTISNAYKKLFYFKPKSVTEKS